MDDKRVVSIGFLTARDLDRLGTTFTNHIPAPADDSFSDLLARLDHVEATPLGNGISILPTDAGKL